MARMATRKKPKLPKKKTELDNKTLIYFLMFVLTFMFIFFLIKFGGIMNIIRAI